MDEPECLKNGEPDLCLKNGKVAQEWRAPGKHTALNQHFTNH